MTNQPIAIIGTNAHVGLQKSAKSQSGRVGEKGRVGERESGRVGEKGRVGERESGRVGERERGRVGEKGRVGQGESGRVGEREKGRVGERESGRVGEKGRVGEREKGRVGERQARYASAEKQDMLYPLASSSSFLIPLSARSKSALRALAKQYDDFLTSDPEGKKASLTDLAYTTRFHRSHHSHRLAMLVRNHKQLSNRLRAFAKGKNAPNAFYGITNGQAPKLLMVYTGMGPQWWGMGRELMAQVPVFRQTLEECDAMFAKIAGWSLLDVWKMDKKVSRMGETQVAQPANFMLQVALTALWQSWGITPDAVMGHSVGEIAAAYVSGALSLEDALRVVYHRSRLPQQHELRRSLANLQPRASHMPLYSTVLGKQINGDELDAAYWSQNVREPVQLAQTIQTISDDQYQIFLEVGPHPVLAHSIKESLQAAGSKGELLSSLRRKKAELPHMLASLAQLYALGLSVNWQSITEKGQFIPLPAYAWQKERYWQESNASCQDHLGLASHPFLNRELNLPHPA